MLSPEERSAHAARVALLEGQDWAGLGVRLRAYTLRRLGTSADVELARDLAQEAIRRALDPAYAAWVPEDGPLLRFLGSVVNGLLRDRWTRQGTRRERLARTEEEAADSSRHPRSPGDPERDLSAREQARSTLTSLRERLHDDPEALTLLDLFAEGLETAAEQAARLGAPVATVYRARARLTRQALIVRAALAGDSHEAP